MNLQGNESLLDVLNHINFYDLNNSDWQYVDNTSYCSILEFFELDINNSNIISYNSKYNTAIDKMPYRCILIFDEDNFDEILDYASFVIETENTKIAIFEIERVNNR